MKLLVATAMLLALATGAARADSENCRKSREYLLGHARRRSDPDAADL